MSIANYCVVVLYSPCLTKYNSIRLQRVENRCVSFGTCHFPPSYVTPICRFKFRAFVSRVWFGSVTLPSIPGSVGGSLFLGWLCYFSRGLWKVSTCGSCPSSIDLLQKFAHCQMLPVAQRFSRTKHIIIPDTFGFDNVLDCLLEGYRDSFAGIPVSCHRST